MPEILLKITPPKGMPTTKDFTQAFERAVRKTTGLVERDIQATMKTWARKADFETVVTSAGGSYTISTGTDDPVYGYVDAGTKPHAIRAKRARSLRFYGGFRPKTRVGVIGSGAGGASGAAVFREAVFHPGTAPRRFLLTISRRRQKTLEQETAQNLAKVARGKP